MHWIQMVFAKQHVVYVQRATERGTLFLIPVHLLVAIISCSCHVGGFHMVFSYPKGDVLPPFVNSCISWFHIISTPLLENSCMGLR